MLPHPPNPSTRTLPSRELLRSESFSPPPHAHHPCPSPAPLPSQPRSQVASTCRAGVVSRLQASLWSVQRTTIYRLLPDLCGPAQGPATTKADGEPQSICLSVPAQPSMVPGILGAMDRPSVSLPTPQHTLVLPRGSGVAGTALPALSTCLHDALEEHGVVLHVGMLG